MTYIGKKSSDWLTKNLNFFQSKKSRTVTEKRVIFQDTYFSGICFLDEIQKNIQHTGTYNTFIKVKGMCKICLLLLSIFSVFIVFNCETVKLLWSRSISTDFLQLKEKTLNTD